MLRAHGDSGSSYPEFALALAERASKRIERFFDVSTLGRLSPPIPASAMATVGLVIATF